MKLLVSELEVLRTYVSREFYHVMRALITDFNWRHVETRELWNGSQSIRDTLLHHCDELPEVILFWEGYELLTARALEIQRLPCRKAILADDLHWWDVAMRSRKTVGFALCETVISTVGYAWNKLYPEFAGTKKIVWVPHSASPDFRVPYNPSPVNAIFVSGAAGNYYPLRDRVTELSQAGAYAIVRHDHPGYDTGYDYDQNEAVGRGYAMKINSYRAAFTDSSRFHYVLAKYFEIPATGALLVADDSVSGPLRQLGFVENEHYVAVSADNLEEKIRFVLDERNHDELDQLRRRGQELVWERHKSSDRARQIDAACTQ
ncbi:MAG TPA: glycosyltransferase [Pyrinomonadaceae bacterium]|nr:glycosyltransferase [Pyrinomonadaceae bacterium]